MLLHALVFKTGLIKLKAKRLKLLFFILYIIYILYILYFYSIVSSRLVK